VSGYQLEHLTPEHGFNLPAFVCGTEGTLGVVTRATVRLVADPPHGVTVALGYPSMAEAADAVTALLPFHPVACEGMDRRIVDVVARAKGSSAVPDLPRGDGWMFLDVRGDDAAEVASRAQQMTAASGALDARVVSDPAEAAALWRIRSDGAGLAGVSLEQLAWAGWEDAAVPPADLGAYLRDFEELLESHGLHGLPYGHFGEGCVHCRIDYPLDAADGPEQYRSFVADAAALVARHGGSASGEHGDGRARSALLPAMYSPEAISLFGQVKGILDPDNLLNPGVLVDPRPVEADIRMFQARNSPLTLSHPQFAHDVHQCTGVGKCIAENSPHGGVMCPSYQASHNEKDSTRGRAKVLQEMVNGTLGARLGLPRGGAGAGPVPGLQGLRPRLPDRHRHGLLPLPGVLREVPPWPATALPLRDGLAAALGAAHLGDSLDGDDHQRRAPGAGDQASGTLGGRGGPAPPAADLPARRACPQESGFWTFHDRRRGHCGRAPGRAGDASIGVPRSPASCQGPPMRSHPPGGRRPPGTAGW
jgi:hypothetical protein